MEEDGVMEGGVLEDGELDGGVMEGLSERDKTKEVKDER